jgi:hypothetical protein
VADSDQALPAADGAAALVESLCRATLDGDAGQGLDGVAVSRCSESRYAGVVYASDDVAVQLEELQETLAEGTGPLALLQRSAVLVPDLASDPSAPSWIAFVPAAARLGVAAVFALPAQVGAADVGLVTLHGSRAHPLEDEVLHELLRLSDAVALALLVPETAAWSGDGLDVLDASHAVTHQAVGMVSVQLDTSLEMAIAALRAHAFAVDLSLHDVARSVVERRLSFRGRVDDRDTTTDHGPPGARGRGDD